MKKSNIVVLCIFAALLFSGCSDVKERSAALEAIAPKFITAYLNEHIEDNSNSVHFKVSDNEIFTVSTGEKFDNASHNTKDLLKQVSFGRRYNAINVKLELGNIDYQYNEKNDKCTVTYSLKVTKKVLVNDTTGIQISSHIPLKWDSMNFSEKELFREKFYSMLLPYEFDYNYIYNLSADLDVQNLNISIPFKYSKEKKSWNCSKYNLNKPLNAKPADFLKEEFNFENAAKLLAEKNLSLYNRKYFFLPENVEIQKKLDNNMIFYRDRWISKSTYSNINTLKNLSDELSEVLNQPKKFIPVLNKILTVLKNHDDVSTKNEALTHANNCMDRYIKNLDQYADIVAVLHQSSENPNWQMLNLVMIKNSVGRLWEKSLKTILNDCMKKNDYKTFFEQYRNICDNKVFDNYRHVFDPIMKKGMTEFYSKLKELEDGTKNAYRDYAKANTEKKHEIHKKLFQILPKAVNYGLDFKEIKDYCAAWDYLLENFKYPYDKVINDKFSMQFFEKCVKCQRGKFYCSVCRNSYLCSTCHGRGYNRIPTVQGGYRTVSCRRDCRICARSRNTKCRFCAGRGYKLRKDITAMSRLHRDFSTALTKKIEEVNAALQDLNK